MNLGDLVICKEPNIRFFKDTNNNTNGFIVIGYMIFIGCTNNPDYCYNIYTFLYNGKLIYRSTRYNRETIEEEFNIVG